MKMYTIEELSRCLNMSASTLRAWEARYNLVSAARSQGGHRIYDGNDLRFYAYICHLKNQGIKISSIAEKSLIELKQAAKLFFAKSPENNGLSPFNIYCIKAALQALIENRIDDCLDTVDQAIMLAHDAVEFSMFALGFMTEVGEAWTRNKISIASEHLISARIRSALSKFLYEVRRTNLSLMKRQKWEGQKDAETVEQRPPFSVVVAGLPGDLHEMGLLLVAIHLQSWGLRVCYLGPTLPTEQLELFANNLFTSSFGVLCLSASTALEKGSATESARFLDRFVATRHVTFIGGGCTRHFEHSQEQFKNLIFSNDLEKMRAVVLELQLLQNAKTPLTATLIAQMRSRVQKVFST